MAYYCHSPCPLSVTLKLRPIVVQKADGCRRRLAQGPANTPRQGGIEILQMIAILTVIQLPERDGRQTLTTDRPHKDYRPILVGINGPLLHHRRLGDGLRTWFRSPLFPRNYNAEHD